MGTYSDDHGCIRDNIDNCSVLQRASANSPFGLTQLRCFIDLFVQSDVHSNWFAQLILVFYVKPDGVAETNEELKFVQDFEITAPVDEIGSVTQILSVRAADYEIDRSINFDPKRFDLVEATEWHGIVLPFSIASVYYVGKAKNIARLICLQIPLLSHIFHKSSFSRAEHSSATQTDL